MSIEEKVRKIIIVGCTHNQLYHKTFAEERLCQSRQIIQEVRKHDRERLRERFKTLKSGTEYGEYYWKDIEQIINEVMK